MKDFNIKIGEGFDTIVTQVTIGEFALEQIKTNDNLCDYFCGYLSTHYQMCYLYRIGLHFTVDPKHFVRTGKCKEVIKCSD